MENTVTSDGEPMGAAGHGVKQNQRAHDNLRAGSHRGGQRRSGSRDGRGRISGRGGLDAAAAATATAMSRTTTAGRRRGARGSDFRAGGGGGERARVFLDWLVRGLLQRPDDPELGPSFHRGCREGSACAAGRSATIALGDDGAVSGARELTQGYLGAGHSTTQRPTTRAASVDRVVLAQRETVRATLSHCAAFADGEKAPQTRARASGLYPGDSVSTV